MRKPKDFDAQLKALAEKAKALKDNKLYRLGELVAASGADTLDIETLAGGLLAIVETSDAGQKEAWRRRGAEMFRGKEQGPAGGARSDAERTQTSDSSRKPA